MGGRHKAQWDTEGISLVKEVTLKNCGDSGTELQLCQIMTALKKQRNVILLALQSNQISEVRQCLKKISLVLHANANRFSGKVESNKSAGRSPGEENKKIGSRGIARYKK